LLLLDEQRAVEFARSVGLTIMRTGTVYAAAKRAGLIDALRTAGFWLRERDYQATLNACGEP